MVLVHVSLFVALLVGGAAGAKTAAAGLPIAEPLGFTAQVTPSTVELGRPFVYEIEVKHRPSESYELPRPLSLGTAGVRDVSVERLEDGEDSVTTRIRIEAAVYDQLGEATLPDLILTMSGEGGLKELRIPGAPVTISVASDSDQLEDIRPPRDLVVRSYTTLWVLLLLCSAALIAWYLHRREAARRASLPPAPPPRIDADVRALASLRGLEAEALPASGRGREHYFRLSEIVRIYFGDALEISAPEMTDSELVAALWQRRPRGLDLPAFEAWIERGTFARFAKGEILQTQAVADLDEARRMIRSVAAALRLEGKAPQASDKGTGSRGGPVAGTPGGAVAESPSGAVTGTPGGASAGTRGGAVAGPEDRTSAAPKAEATTGGASIPDAAPRSDAEEDAK